MMRLRESARRAALMVLLTGALISAPVGRGAVSKEGSGQPQDRAAASGPWDDRLLALDPAHPEEYFNLGEEVASEASDVASRDLAKRLFVLAYELDKLRAIGGGAPERSSLGPGVCLALASLAKNDGERRWLQALARSLDDDGAAVSAMEPPARAATEGESARFALATVIGLSRAGDGRRAQTYLDRPGVQQILEDLDTPSASPEAAAMVGFVRRAVRDWPACPQCRNQRVIPSGVKTGEKVLCDTCRGNPGPALADENFAKLLRVEASLLGGRNRSWSSQLVADSGAPLRDLDPAELAATYSVDSSRPLWREGKWVSQQEGGVPER